MFRRTVVGTVLALLLCLGKVAVDVVANEEDESQAFIGPTAHLEQQTSLRQDPPSGPTQPVETEEATMRLTLEDARRYDEWPVLVPDSSPDMVSSYALDEAYVEFITTTYVGRDLEPSVSSTLVIPGTIEVRQHYTQSVSQPSSSRTTTNLRSVSVMAGLVNGNPALLYRTNERTVELMWGNEDCVIYASALRQEITELDMLRFANALKPAAGYD